MPLTASKVGLSVRHISPPSEPNEGRRVVGVCGVSAPYAAGWRSRPTSAGGPKSRRHGDGAARVQARAETTARILGRIGKLAGAVGAARIGEPHDEHLLIVGGPARRYQDVLLVSPGGSSPNLVARAAFSRAPGYAAAPVHVTILGDDIQATEGRRTLLGSAAWRLVEAILT